MTTPMNPKLPKNNRRKPAIYSYDAFVSHNKADKKVARHLVHLLEAEGYAIWFDENSIPDGTSIIQAVQDGLRQSRRIIVLLSPASLRSDWVEKEYLTQMMKDPMNRTRRIIPVLLKECKVLPDFLRHLKYIDATGGIGRSVLARIMLALGHPLKKGTKKAATA